jgi:hypothetical protein
MSDLEILNEDGTPFSGGQKIVDAGKETAYPVFLKSNIDYAMTAMVEVEGDSDVHLKNSGDVIISPNSSVPVDIVVFPSLTRMKPLSFSLKVSYRYVVV